MKRSSFIKSLFAIPAAAKIATDISTDTEESEAMPVVKHQFTSKDDEDGPGWSNRVRVYYKGEEVGYENDSSLVIINPAVLNAKLPPL